MNKEITIKYAILKFINPLLMVRSLKGTGENPAIPSRVIQAITPPSEETLLNLYKLTDGLLISNNFKKYEVSNYAIAGQESFHNIKIWEGLEYCGFGPGAHGRIKINNSFISISNIL